MCYIDNVLGGYRIEYTYTDTHKGNTSIQGSYVCDCELWSGLKLTTYICTIYHVVATHADYWNFSDN